MNKVELKRKNTRKDLYFNQHINDDWVIKIIFYEIDSEYDDDVRTTKLF